MAGLVMYYVLFFMRLAGREVHIAGVTPHPDRRRMLPIARNVTMADWEFLTPGCSALRVALQSGCEGGQLRCQFLALQRVVGL